MPNPIKYSITSTLGSYQKGNIAFGTNPISYAGQSGWYNSINIPNGKSVLIEVVDDSTQPSFYVPNSDDEWIRLAKQEGASGSDVSSVSSVKNWFSLQPNYSITNIELPLSIPNIVGNGLIMNLNSKITQSYSGAGISWYDISGFGNIGTLNNGANYNSNGSINFDGTDDFISLSQTVTLSGEFTWSITCESNVMSSTQNRQVYLAGSTGFFEQSDNDTFFIVNSSNLNLELPIGLLPQNKFYNITITRKSDNTFDFYYNGIKQVLRSGGSTSLSNDFQISKVGSVDSGGRYWNGSMSNIILYDKLLSDSEILQNYYQSPIVTDGLVFFVDSGNLVSYESGSTTTYSLVGSLNGTLVNGVSYSNLFGGSFLYDGVNDYIIFTPNNLQPSNSLTLEVWFKSFGSNGRIQGLLYLNYGLGLRLDSNGVIHTRINSMGSLQQFTTSTTYFNNQWNCVTLTLSTSGTANLYVNAILVQQYSISYDGNSPWNSGPGGIGTDINDSSVRGMFGYIGPCRVYNKVLISSEITQNFNAQRSRFGI